jgi:hypothetical protein
LIRIFTLIGLITFFLAKSAVAQIADEWIAGRVSYVTTNSVYVKFENTEKIETGDTLFILTEGESIPALIVNNKSSLSCVCSPIEGLSLEEGQEVSFRIPEKVPDAGNEPQPADTAATVPVVSPVEEEKEEPAEKKRVQQIGGRVSVSSYTNWSNAVDNISQRMRYTFSFGGQHLGGSKLSLEMYMSFIHRNEHWDDIRESVFNGLKIYNFSLRYDISEKTRIWLGRKINYRLSSMGAIDGLQFEQVLGTFTLGAVAGSRPDYEDYGLNMNLFQYGIYISHDFENGAGRMENTLAFMDQENDWNTDRRFIYFQHTNTLLRHLFFMATAEFDLYSIADGTSKNTFDLSNIYLLLRYRARDNLTISASYTARQQIIYYETYRDYLDRLLENPALQGFRLMINYRPVKHLSIGARGSYRFRPDDPQPATDAYGYIMYSMVPGIRAALTGSVTWLETSYLKGWIYSIGLSRDIVPGKLFGALNYRYASYDFNTTDLPAVQHIGEVNLNWRIYRKLSLGLYYECTFEEAITFNRVFVNLTQRF